MRNKDKLVVSAASTATLKAAAERATGTYKNKIVNELRKRGE